MVSKAPSMVFTRYLTNILDNIQDAILLLGVEPGDTYRILMTNAALHRETGIKKNCVGKTVDAVLGADSLAKLTRMYSKVRKSKKPAAFIEWYDMPLGRQMYEVTLIPIFNAMGECVQIATISRNTTELYHLREQQREAAETLEQVAYNLRVQ